MPECLWEMRNLSVLHLTGNSLTGNLVHDISPLSTMEDLALSHNKLSGAIPVGLPAIHQVDLSYNQFSQKYSVHQDHDNGSSLNLEINRLSGHLPLTALRQVSQLNILRGNLFSCDTIPKNDEFVDDYVCGSEDLNESLIVFVSAVAAVSLIIVSMLAFQYLGWQSGLFSVELGNSDDCGEYGVGSPLSLLYKSVFLNGIQRHQLRQHDSVLLKISHFINDFRRTMRLFVLLTVVMLIVVFPIYILKAADESGGYMTHENTYAWFWTFAYMHGVTASSLIMTSWMIVLGVFFHKIIMLSAAEIADADQMSDNYIDCGDGSEASKIDSSTSSWRSGILIMASLLLNAVCTITVNAFYVYVIGQPLPVYVLFGIQFSLALFRLFYSYCMFPLLSRPVSDPISNIRFRLRLLVFNNLVIPCLATAFTSPACFQVQNSQFYVASLRLKFIYYFS